MSFTISTLTRSALRPLERFDELRQCADCGILRDAIFTANLALHFAFAERIRAGQHPAEYRVVLWRRSLRVSEAEQVAVRPAIALLILHRLVREIVGFAFHVPTGDGVAQTATPATHRVHVFREVEQVRADAADLAQVRECVSLRLRVAVRHDERESEDGRIVLRRATASLISTMRFTARMPSALMQRTMRVVVLLHQIAFGDVIRAAFGAEDQEAVEPRPVIHLPRIAAARVANLVRTRNRLRLRRGAAVEDLCVVDSHDGLLSSDAPPTLGTIALVELRTSW